MEIKKIISNKKKLIEGPLLIEEKIYKDERGFFIESWNQKLFNKCIKEEINFVQDNHSSSKKGVLRGLHYQKQPYAQAKLIRCIQGEILDVIVDIRKNSESYMEWASIKLSSKEKKQLWIPIGFAHGFLTLSEEAELFYKTSEYWNKDNEVTLNWSDPLLSINWGNTKNIILSKKDKEGLLLKDIEKVFLF